MVVSRAVTSKIIVIQGCGTGLSKVQGTGLEKSSTHRIRRQNRERRVERLKCGWTKKKQFFEK